MVTFAFGLEAEILVRAAKKGALLPNVEEVLAAI